MGSWSFTFTTEKVKKRKSIDFLVARDTREKHRLGYKPSRSSGNVVATPTLSVHRLALALGEKERSEDPSDDE